LSLGFALPIILGELAMISLEASEKALTDSNVRFWLGAPGRKANIQI